MNIKRKLIIRSIDKYVDDIDIIDRIYVLNILSFNNVSISNFYEEGLGIRILYKNIPTHILHKVLDHIEASRKKHLIRS